MNVRHTLWVLALGIAQASQADIAFEDVSGAYGIDHSGASFGVSVAT